MYEWKTTLIHFLDDLRSHEFTKDATLVVDVEMGTGMMTEDVHTLVRQRYRNVLFVNDLLRKSGTLTTNKVKRECEELARECVLRFSNPFVTERSLDVEAVKCALEENVANDGVCLGRALRLKNRFENDPTLQPFV